MKKIAFFDFDNTIYDGYTYEDFIKYASEKILKDNKYQRRAKHVLQTTTNYNDIVVAIAEIVGKIITGWQRKTFVEHCQKACGKSKILDWVIPVTKFLESNGFKNILVTASFDEMVLDSREILPIDETFCSIFEEVNGKYTGKIELLLNNEKKREAIESIVAKNNTFSIAFGDSMGDAPMLDAVDLPFLVRNYDEEVKSLARKKAWHLGADPEEIIGVIRNKLGS